MNIVRIDAKRAEILWMTALWGRTRNNQSALSRTDFGELLDYEGLESAQYYAFNDERRDEVARLLRDMASSIIEGGKNNDDT